MLIRAVPRIVGTRLSRLLRRLQGLLRLFTLRMLILTRVRASPPFSHVWPPLFCPTQGRHPLRPFSLPSVMATTGAASVPAEASPPSLVSCVMSRTSTRAPQWTSPLAPCSRRSNESLARLPPAVASEEWAPQARPPRVGDVIMGPLGAPASREDVVMADAEAPATPSLTVDLPLVDLPAGFTQRIRALPSSTILHVPASCRLRMISVVAQCWNGMAQGRDDYAQLEEGRSKLLLSTVPQGLSVASEVQKRLTLWEERSLRRSCSAPRSSSCLSARQGSGANPVVCLTPLSGAIARDVPLLLAPIGRPPLGLSPPCFLSMSKRTCVGPESSFQPPTLVRPLTVILTWLPLLLYQSPPGTGHSLACTMRLSLLLAQPEHAQSTSQTYSMSRAGFMPTRFTLRSPRCFAGFLLAPYLLLPGGSLGHGSAGNARKMASRVQSRWVSSFALPTPSDW